MARVSGHPAPSAAASKSWSAPVSSLSDLPSWVGSCPTRSGDVPRSEALKPAQRYFDPVSVDDLLLLAGLDPTGEQAWPGRGGQRPGWCWRQRLHRQSALRLLFSVALGKLVPGSTAMGAQLARRSRWSTVDRPRRASIMPTPGGDLVVAVVGERELSGLGQSVPR